ncbi:MAG: addiction module protein [Brachymonas sp.]|nr:addiction module protein [Brachymonas sp.]NJS37009.1 addiction module protein [Brachymonas sp.]
MKITELSALPLAQRIEAMEVLWQSLADDSTYDVNPAWHADVLRARVEEIEAGQTTAWPEAKTRLFALAAHFKNQHHA